MQMEYRMLGNSGIKVSKIGMGCWSFGGGAYWGEQSQKDVDAVVSAALDQGVNLFDTAEVYNDGASERSLGTALRGKREKAVIISKVKPSNARPENLRKSCEDTLRRLQTDYLDVYMFHWPINAQAIRHFISDQEEINHPAAVQQAFETMMQLQKEGKIRSIGVSNFGVRQMEQAIATGANIDSLEITYNLLSRAAEREALPFCVQHGIGVVGYMALMQGLLTGKYTSPAQVPAPQAHSRHFRAERGGEQSRHGTNGAEPEMFEAIEKIGIIAKNLGVPMSQLSIAWILQKPALTTTLVGCRNEKQLNENLKAASLQLDEDTLAELDRVTQPLWEKLGDNMDYYENPARSRIF